jgi:hypothetical protein
MIAASCGVQTIIWSLKPSARYEFADHAHSMNAAAVLPACGAQMTKNNVGSLLVFDGNQVTCDSPSSASACVGIITERGM